MVGATFTPASASPATTLRLAAMTNQTAEFEDYITATQKMRAYRGKIEAGSPLAPAVPPPPDPEPAPDEPEQPRFRARPRFIAPPPAAAMTPAERVSSALNNHRVVWSGINVAAAAPGVLWLAASLALPFAPPP